MRAMGLAGAVRGRAWVTTTQSQPALDRPHDLVDRQFEARRPNQLWVSDFERHEALSNRAVVKGHRPVSVAAGAVKLRAA
jgi:transposase InsO family protein